MAHHGSYLSDIYRHPKKPRSSYQRFGLRAAWLRWRQCTSTNPWLLIFFGRSGGPNRIWLWPSWSIVGCSCILTEIPSGNWWTETNSEPEIRLIHHYDPKNAPTHLWKSVHPKLGTCLPWGFASASPAVQDFAPITHATLTISNKKTLTISKKKQGVYPYNSQSFDLVAAMALLPWKLTYWP